MDLEKAIEHFRYKSEGMCTFALLIEKLVDSDKKILLDNLAKGTPTITLVSALRSQGYKIGEPTVNLHRQNKCKCQN